MLIVDEFEDYIDPADELFEIIKLKDLAIPNQSNLWSSTRQLQLDSFQLLLCLLSFGFRNWNEEFGGNRN